MLLIYVDNGPGAVTVGVNHLTGGRLDASEATVAERETRISTLEQAIEEEKTTVRVLNQKSAHSARAGVELTLLQRPYSSRTSASPFCLESGLHRGAQRDLMQPPKTSTPTYHTTHESPSVAWRQLDFVFASRSIASEATATALNREDEWGPSDHCQVVIDLSL